MLVASILSGITDAVTDVIGNHGLYAVFLLMLVDAVLPAASEVVMVYAGAVAAGAFADQTVTLLGYDFSPGFDAYVAIALAGAVGYLVGSLLGWWIGRRGGHPFLERSGRWLHLDAEKIVRAERWFDRWGDWAVLLGRVTPVVRSFISVPAGVFEAPLVRYTVLTAIGSAAWCFAFAGAGWAAGASWEDFHHAFRYADYVVVAVVLAGIAVLAWKLVRRRRAGSDPAPGYTDPSE
jgi:membrane protein DedA with SNARE-associated domain